MPCGAAKWVLARAQRALGAKSMRATVEQALRQAADQAEDARAARARDQRTYLDQLALRVDVEVLASETMWR